MRSRSEIETAIGNLARTRVLEYIRVQRRGGRSVVTLVDIAEETALDPETVEAVMRQLERSADVPVRRATADQIRWHIRR
jgi:DNA-binding MarR family transcriptional regulator